MAEEHRAGLEKAAENGQSCQKSGTGWRILGLWGNSAVKRKRQSRPPGRQDTSSHKNIKNQGLPQIKSHCLQQERSLDKHTFQHAAQTMEQHTPAPGGHQDSNLHSRTTAKTTKNAAQSVTLLWGQLGKYKT